MREFQNRLKTAKRLILQLKEMLLLYQKAILSEKSPQLQTVIILGAASVIFERKAVKQVFKKGFLLSSVCGISNGLTNLLVLICVAVVPASLFFPILSGGQLILVFLISVILFKEKFLKRQLFGLFSGFIAILLMNI